MEKIKFTLTKSVNYNLKPFGRFEIKWSESRSTNRKMNILPLNELSWNNNNEMPVNNETDRQIINYMVKHKTDILIDESGVTYTRLGDGFVNMTHKKIEMYKNMLKAWGVQDNEESWDDFVKS